MGGVNKGEAAVLAQCVAQVKAVDPAANFANCNRSQGKPDIATMTANQRGTRGRLVELLAELYRRAGWGGNQRTASSGGAPAAAGGVPVPGSVPAAPGVVPPAAPGGVPAPGAVPPAPGQPSQQPR